MTTQDRQEAIAILHGRIADIRAQETYFKRMGVLYDHNKVANMIGGLKRVIKLLETEA